MDKIWPFLLLLSIVDISLGKYIKENSSEGPRTQTSAPQVELVSFKITENERVVQFEWSNNQMAHVDVEHDDDECIYKGKFLEDEHSRVLVTGCKDEEKSIMIQSRMYGDTLAIGRNGSVEAVKWNSQLQPINMFEKRDFSDQSDTGRELIREKRSYNSGSARKKVHLPAKLHLPLRIYIAPSWKNKFTGDLKKAKEVLSFVKSFYLHPSLNTKFDITFTNSDFFDTRAEFEPSRWNLNRLPSYVSAPMTGRAALVYLTATPSCSYGEYTGYAKLASICDKDKKKSLSISCWYKSTITTAKIVAHEIGHNLGFYHDFQPERYPKSTARTRTCGPGQWKGGPNNKLMNYNYDMVSSWSSCSNEDFKNYFLWITDKEPFCLKDSANTTAAPTPSPSPSSVSPLSTPSVLSSTAYKTTPTASTTTTPYTTTARSYTKIKMTETTLTTTTTTPTTPPTTTPTTKPTTTTPKTTTTKTTPTSTNSISPRTVAPEPDPETGKGNFDLWIVSGGILLSLGLAAIGIVGFKFYRLRSHIGLNYRIFWGVGGDKEILLTANDI